MLFRRHAGIHEFEVRPGSLDGALCFCNPSVAFFSRPALCCCTSPALPEINTARRLKIEALKLWSVDS